MTSLSRHIGRDRIAELWRYYYVGLINTGFGYGLFSLLVWIGLNAYAAQLLSHLLGMAFNYLTLSRHVFRDKGGNGSGGKIGPYIGAYAVNYGVSLGLLAALSTVIASPYLAGFLAMLGASMLNYLVLSRYVFRRRSA